MSQTCVSHARYNAYNLSHSTLTIIRTYLLSRKGRAWGGGVQGYRNRGIGATETATLTWVHPVPLLCLELAEFNETPSTKFSTVRTNIDASWNFSRIHRTRHAFPPRVSPRVYTDKFRYLRIAERSVQITSGGVFAAIKGPHLQLDVARWQIRLGNEGEKNASEAGVELNQLEWKSEYLFTIFIYANKRFRSFSFFFLVTLCEGIWKSKGIYCLEFPVDVQ